MDVAAPTLGLKRTSSQLHPIARSICPLHVLLPMLDYQSTGDIHRFVLYYSQLLVENEMIQVMDDELHNTWKLSQLVISVLQCIISRSARQIATVNIC